MSTSVVVRNGVGLSGVSEKERSGVRGRGEEVVIRNGYKIDSSFDDNHCSNGVGVMRKSESNHRVMSSSAVSKRPQSLMDQRIIDSAAASSMTVATNGMKDSNHSQQQPHLRDSNNWPQGLPPSKTNLNGRAAAVMGVGEEGQVQGQTQGRGSPTTARSLGPESSTSDVPSPTSSSTASISLKPVKTVRSPPGPGTSSSNNLTLQTYVDHIPPRSDSLPPQRNNSEKFSSSTSPKLPKARKDRFFKVFSDIAETDIVIKSYHCALVGDILLQGFLYVTSNWFCFHSKLMGKKRIKIPVAAVTDITKKKTAMIIPNAIGIVTETEKFLFGSLMSRDNTYELMVNVWKQKQQIPPEQEDPSVDQSERLMAKSTTSARTNSSDECMASSSDSYCSNLDYDNPHEEQNGSGSRMRSEQSTSVTNGLDSASVLQSSTMMGGSSVQAHHSSTSNGRVGNLKQTSSSHCSETPIKPESPNGITKLAFGQEIISGFKRVLFLLFSAVLLAYKLVQLQTSLRANVDRSGLSNTEHIDAMHKDMYYLRHEYHYSAIQRINSVLESHISMLDQINQAMKGLQQLASRTTCSSSVDTSADKVVDETDTNT